jgi:hypothetical protein
MTRARSSPSTRRAFLADLGAEIVELRVDGDAPQRSRAQARGIAGDDAFTVGSTLSVPLHDRPAADAITAIDELHVATAIGSRRATLDDVYLRLTGAHLSAAA